MFALHICMLLPLWFLHTSFKFLEAKFQQEFSQRQGIEEDQAFALQMLQMSDGLFTHPILEANIALNELSEKIFNLTNNICKFNKCRLELL